jgi:hypothetical protein
MIEISQYLFYKLINVLSNPFYINKIYPVKHINIPPNTKY